jgi:hypothetical protein
LVHASCCRNNVLLHIFRDITTAWGSVYDKAARKKTSGTNVFMMAVRVHCRRPSTSTNDENTEHVWSDWQIFKRYQLEAFTVFFTTLGSKTLTLNTNTGDSCWRPNHWW